MCATEHELCCVMRCDMAQLECRTGALIVGVRKERGGSGDCGRGGGRVWTSQGLFFWENGIWGRKRLDGGGGGVEENGGASYCGVL